MSGIVGQTTEPEMRNQSSVARPRFREDGVVHVPAFDLPPSGLASAEARIAQMRRARMPAGIPPVDLDIAVVRKGLEAMLAPQVANMRETYAVTIEDADIGGVRTQIISPADRASDDSRILINLHGGGFSMCADACALLESIPVAALSGIPVVTVDYRMAPEATHPAAIEDLEKVYRQVLGFHQAKHIGIYGCSAGGFLTAQAAAWFPSQGLPMPGAIGVFGAGGVRSAAGDSAYVTAYIDGSFPAPAKFSDPAVDSTRGYFAGSDLADSVISPALHLDALANFPPTLIITGTRAMDLSPAVYTNSQLMKAGVRTTLIVGEAMGHCYIYDSQLPEARDAHHAIANFFVEHLA